MFNDKEKISGCILGGAIGDAFGAPLEGIWKIEELTDKFGPHGMQEFAPYTSYWDDSEAAGLGIITDDTTMMACTLAAIIETKKKDQPLYFKERAMTMQWQYYLAWGSKQKYSEGMEQFIHPKTKIPDYLEPFLFRCGAGKGTIAALLCGYQGGIERPVEYDCMIGDKHMTSPNAGCGGQMRIAPISFLFDEWNVPLAARSNAAITHGDIDAMNATVVTANLISYALQEKDLGTTLSVTKDKLQYLPDNKNVVKAWKRAEEAFTSNSHVMMAIDKLGKGYGNPFLALPVLSQTIYSLYAASTLKADPYSFKETIRLAANHTGDSDSVAAIVGNVVGASWGQKALPQDWVDHLQKKEALLNLTNIYLQTANGPN